MRNAFAAELLEIAQQNEAAVMLSGDIGNRLFDKFKDQFPNRFLNCGVAEADMVGIAAGMAMCGLRPITYTINSFLTARAFEQIKIDVCYHNLPVLIVGVGGGLSYAELGGTHQSCEDIGLMRMLPHMTVVCPGDALEVRAALRAAMNVQGPVYIRLGKKGEKAIHEAPPEFAIGKGIVLKDGEEICLLGAGNMALAAREAAELLGQAGVSARAVSFHTIKPLDEGLLQEAFSKFAVVATLEEHTLNGGLGGAVAEWLADRPPLKARLLRFGTPDDFWHQAGKQSYARKTMGLTPEAIAERTIKLFKEIKENGGRG